MTAKSISIKIVMRRSGGCVRKAVVLTSGGLRPCPGNGTGGIERDPEGGAEVSRGHSKKRQSVHSIEALARKGRNGRTRRTGNARMKARTVPFQEEG